MERVNRILRDQSYRLYLLKNKALEEYRPFCHHDFDHMLAVARLTYLLLQEERCPYIKKDLAYAAGLLHDIGRWKEYQEGADHAQASAVLAKPILEKAGYVSAEQDLIVKAIAQHRDKGGQRGHRSPLSRALSRADRLSRLCFQCGALGDCRRSRRRPQAVGLLY